MRKEIKFILNFYFDCKSDPLCFNNAWQRKHNLFFLITNVYCYNYMKRKFITRGTKWCLVNLLPSSSIALFDAENRLAVWDRVSLASRDCWKHVIIRIFEAWIPDIFMDNFVGKYKMAIISTKYFWIPRYYLHVVTLKTLKCVKRSIKKNWNQFYSPFLKFFVRADLYELDWSSLYGKCRHCVINQDVIATEKTPFNELSTTEMSYLVEDKNVYKSSCWVDHVIIKSQYWVFLVLRNRVI